MDLRRRSLVVLVLGAAAWTGCVTPQAKPDPISTPTIEAATITPPPAATGPSNPTDPMNRLRSFIAGDGLSSTPAKPGEAHRLTAAWSKNVIYAPDPVHGGDPVPGLMGKLWLFGPEESVPLGLDGELFIGAWDMRPKAVGGQPVLLEVWHIDREAARKLRHKGFMGGEEYRVFLPWSQYTVDLNQINVIARFNGADGRSVVSTPQTLTVDHSATLERAAERLRAQNPGAPVLPPPAAGTETVVPQPGQFPLNGK